MTRPPQAAIVLMARPPARGTVKSRLAAAIGPDRALAVYQRLLERVRVVAHAAAERTGAVVVWATVGDDGPRWSRGFDPDAADHLQQPEGDLGSRMRAVFEQLLAAYGPVMMVGADAPDLEPDDLVAAHDIARRDLVAFIPASDGGYIAVAMQHLAMPVFFDHPWGNPTVLSETQKALDKAGISWWASSPRHDLDTAEDLKRFPWLESPSDRA